MSNTPITPADKYWYARGQEAMRAKCEAICQQVMQNWRDASLGTGALGIAYSNQAAGAEQCLNAIAALKGN